MRADLFESESALSAGFHFVAQLHRKDVRQHSKLPFSIALVADLSHRQVEQGSVSFKDPSGILQGQCTA